MKYELEYSDFDGSEFACLKDEEITEAVFKEYVTQIKGSKSRFMILKSEQPIANSIYLQSCLDKKTKKIAVETRLVKSDDFEHFEYKTDDIDEVVSFYMGYWQWQKLPDLAKWQNINDYFVMYYYDEKAGLSVNTVHPEFAKAFNADFYYDENDASSPFNVKVGKEAMLLTESELKKDEDLNQWYLIDFVDEAFKAMQVKGLKLIKINPSLIKSEKSSRDLVKACKIIVAIAFTGIKITGLLVSDVKLATLTALKILIDLFDGEQKKCYQIMHEDIKNYFAEEYGQDAW